MPPTNAELVEAEYHKYLADIGRLTQQIPPERQFVTKDSGKREAFDSGMVRDTEAGKTDYTLIFDGPMLDRWAEHMTRGAQKYAARNWMQAAGERELNRFLRSAARHFRQWLRGDRDEDHAAAVIFNINGYEYVRDRMAFERERALKAA